MKNAGKPKFLTANVLNNIGDGPNKRFEGVFQVLSWKDVHRNNID